MYVGITYVDLEPIKSFNTFTLCVFLECSTAKTLTAYVLASHEVMEGLT
jgi:hypothetical protein